MVFSLGRFVNCGSVRFLKKTHEKIIHLLDGQTMKVKSDEGIRGYT